MRILIMSMPFLAIVTILVSTAQRVPDRQPTLRESILPETLSLVRTMKGFRRTIASQIDRTEKQTAQPTVALQHAPLTGASRLTWSAGDWVSAE